LCTRRRITAAAAKTTHKRSATNSVNSTIQMALLKAIKLEDKIKHLVELEEVVANEGNHGVISAAEFDFVLKLSCVALFREISIIIHSEVKAVAGAACRQIQFLKFRNLSVKHTVPGPSMSCREIKFDL